MKARLTGKRVFGYLWAGPGSKWTKKENYFQLEDEKLVTALVGTSGGSFWIRCKGKTCEVTLKNSRGRILGTTILALPGGKKR